LNLEQKQAVVAEVADVAATAQSVIGAEYRGLRVGDMTRLRAEARKNGVYVRVVRNTLARRAMAGTPFECVQDSLVGPLVLAFSREDPGAAARVVGDFAKSNDRLVVKVVALKGRLLSPADVLRLAQLPTKDQAISLLMSVMRAPVEKLVRTLAEPSARLARTLAAVRDQKEAA
jgi:large subunit ribosomal protein L10